MIRDVRRVVHNHVKTFVPERHLAIIGNHRWPELLVDVDSDHLAIAALPEAPGIYGSVKNPFWPLMRVKAKHAFQKFGIRAFPNRGQRLISSEEVSCWFPSCRHRLSSPVASISFLEQWSRCFLSLRADARGTARNDRAVEGKCDCGNMLTECKAQRSQAQPSTVWQAFSAESELGRNRL